MSLQVSSKNVRESYEVVTIGYCDAQYLLSFECNHCYTCGVYGWNSDIYFMDSIGYSGTVISTGYRPVQGRRIDHKLLEKNEKKAREIMSRGSHPEAKKRMIRKLLRECIENALESED